MVTINLKQIKVKMMRIFTVGKKTFSNVRTYEKLHSVNKKYETYIIKIQNRGKTQYL